MSVNFLKKDPLAETFLGTKLFQFADMLFALAIALLLIWRFGRGSDGRRRTAWLLKYRHIAK